MVKFGILTIYASLYFYETICPFLCVKGKRAGRNIFLIQFRRAVSLSGYFKNKPYISSLTYWAGVLVCAIKHMVVLSMAGFLTSDAQFYVIFLESWLTDTISWFSHFSHTAPEGTYPRKIRDAFRQLVSTSFFQNKGFHFFHAKPMRLFDV